MDNLSRFLTAIAWGLDEQAGALSDDGVAAIDSAGAALRDYAAQMRVVAGATQSDGAVAWTGIDDEIGVDLEPEPEPLIRIVFGTGDVEAIARDVEVPSPTAISRAVRWAPAIQLTATELCSSQLRSVMETDDP